MKKRQILIAAISVGFITSCSNPQPVVTKDLTPVDDATGMERAEKILENITSASDIFEIVPHNFTIDDVNTLTEHSRLIDTTSSEVPSIIETNIDNAILKKFHVDFSLENYFLHAYLETKPEVGIILTYDYHYFYDKNSKTMYTLYNVVNAGKIGFAQSDVEEEDVKDKIVNALVTDLPLPVLDSYKIKDYLIPSEYLTKLTKKDRDTNEYNVLNLYNEIKTELSTRGDKEQYFSWQFGSDNETSLSIRNNLKAYTSEEFEPDITRLEGYIEGDNPFAEILLFPPLLRECPDLVVIKDNILSSAEYKTKKDLESVEAPGVKKGAFFMKSEETRNVDIAKDNATIVYPDISEYIFDLI